MMAAYTHDIDLEDLEVEVIDGIKATVHKGEIIRTAESFQFPHVKELIDKLNEKQEYTNE